jgi:hypothetical protein
MKTYTEWMIKLTSDQLPKSRSIKQLLFQEQEEDILQYEINIQEEILSREN